MVKVLVDTDILIDYTKGYPGLLENLFKKQSRGTLELYINPIIITEFLADQNLKDPQKEQKAKEFLAFFSFQDITKKIAFSAGKLIRENKVAFLADAYIGATCIVENLSLATRNKAHFPKIAKLKFKCLQLMWKTTSI